MMKRQQMLKGSLSVIALSPLAALTGCGKPRHATAISGTPSITSQDCDGSFQGKVDVAITWDNPVGATYNQQFHLKSDSNNFDNVKNVAFDDPDAVIDTAAWVDGFSGNLTDPCKDGSFVITLTPDSNTSAKVVSVPVTVKSLGYVALDFPALSGNPVDFKGKFKLKNCGAAAVRFTLTATLPANGNIVNATFAPTPVNIAGGATQEISISGTKADKDKTGYFLLTITPPAPMKSCTHTLHVE